MKRNFTKILAAFALLVGLTIPMGMWGQTTIYSQDGGGTVEGWTFQNNVTTNDIDKGTYWLLDAGDPSDYIQTMSYDLSSYSTANLSLKAATYGSGSSPQAVVQISFDGGNTFNNITLSGTQPTSNTYQTLTATITSGLTNNVVIKYSNGVTTGRGLRLQSLVLTASIGGGTQPETYTVTYNSNITGVSPIVDTYNEGDNVTLRAANTFTNEGYTFSEWNTQADGEGNSYEAEGTISNIQADITLFAIWTEDTPTPSGITATLNIEAYADANSWVNSTKYTTATVAPVTFTANGGVNTGKYYTSGEEWRFYQTESASITISVAEGYTLVSVKPTYNVTNNGVLKNGDVTIESGTTVNASGTSVTFTVGNSGSATNGQVKFTNIDVVYVSDGGTQTASDLTITNESTNLTFDLYNNTTAQVISYTTSSTGAITITPAESDYFSYVHDATAKTITVTPTAVTPSAQTVTISQEADDDYYAGTATFTVSVANSDPNLPGTENNPYTVAQARAAIDAGSGTQGVYATGIVCTASSNLYNNKYLSYYISADGSTESDQLEAYNGLGIDGANFTSVDDVQVGDIVVIYGNLTKFNTTYEFAANNQLVSLERPQSTEPSITLSSYEINATADATEGTIVATYANIPEGCTIYPIFYESDGETPAEYDWITVTINSDNNVAYSIVANAGEARTAYYRVHVADEIGEVDVNSELVTVNQAAYVAPVTGDKYVKVTSTADLTSGQYLIVYEEGSVAFNGGLETLDAVGNTIAVTLNNNEIAVIDATSAAEFTIDVTAGTIKSASGYYIGQTSDANGLKTSKKEEYENAISIGEDGANIVSSSAHLRYNSTSNQTRFRYYKSASYTDQKAIQLYKKVESHTLTIDGYTDVTEGNNNKGYYLIASPVTVDPSEVDGMTEGDFDLYYYDQAGDGEGNEWINYEPNVFNLVPGTGYLYAKKATAETPSYSFNLTGAPYTGTGEIPVAAGWNLIGNPFGVEAEISSDYYALTYESNELIATTAATHVAAMQGVFVNADEDDTVIFEAVENNTPGKGQNIALNLSKATRGASTIDRAIVRFDEGQQLPKFQLFENSTKLYIPQGNEDYAIVRSAAQGEMPVSFRASENGTYTIAVEAENVDMNYLHLIDNMTGADVDLLATPNYTFEARTNDYTSRFRLVFSANSIDEQTAEAFAYFNGTNWTVSNTGDATLQVVDITGRIVSSETINGNATVSINQPAGIYMLRLVNGNDVKVQKVVVR